MRILFPYQLITVINSGIAPRPSGLCNCQTSILSEFCFPTSWLQQGRVDSDLQVSSQTGQREVGTIILYTCAAVHWLTCCCLLFVIIVFVYWLYMCPSRREYTLNIIGADYPGKIICPWRILFCFALVFLLTDCVCACVRACVCVCVHVCVCVCKHVCTSSASAEGTVLCCSSDGGDDLHTRRDPLPMIFMELCKGRCGQWLHDISTLSKVGVVSGHMTLSKGRCGQWSPGIE